MLFFGGKRGFLVVLAGMALYGEALAVASLEAEMREIAASVDGRVGVCVGDGRSTACVRGGERFSMQSVMKLLVGVAALDAVDKKRWRLDDAVTVRREDLSLYVQPLAALVGKDGFTTTVGDLIQRAIIQSDSAATDVLIARLGGPEKVQNTLRQLGVGGIRLDRDERRLQTEIVGLRWRPEYVDAKALEQAIASVPEAVRSKAYAAYQRDERDTATPRGMMEFLLRFRSGGLLSASSTALAMRAMADCVTFPDRLKAGVPAGWTVAHKTGTSSTWQGVTAATNDVGVATAPSGETLAMVVFVGDSRASSKESAAVIARISAAVARHFR